MINQILEYIIKFKEKIEAGINYTIGILGITIGLVDVTHFFQCIGAIAGAALVCLQLYRSWMKK